MTFMKKALIILLFALSASSLFAVDAYYIPLGSPFYDIVDDLYVLSGYARPSDARPYSNAQARLVLERIERDSLSPYAQELYDKAESYVDETVRWRFGDFGIGAELEVNPEIYAHSNTDGFRGENDWAYSYDDREKFLYLGLEFSIGDYFYTFADLMYTMGRYQGEGAEISDNSDYPDGIGAILPVEIIKEDSDGKLIYEDVYFKLIDESSQYYNAFSSNIAYKSKLFEFEWPKRAFVSFGGKSWSLLFGRDRISWGNSRVSNFIIDSHVGYHDMLRLSLFTDRFSYEWTNLFFETRGSGNEDMELGIRMLMAHRLEFRIFPWLDFAISENVMYQARTLSLQYLNPGFIFHNLNNRSMFNAIASAELNITAIKGLDIYFQAVLDQATAPNEDNSQAPAWGILGGAEYSFSPNDTGVLSFTVEFDYTSPVLYRRDGVDFLMYQRVFTIDESYPLKLYYIGYQYGGDVMLLHLDSTYRLYDSFSVSLSFDGMLKGKMDMAEPHGSAGNDGMPNYSGSTPSGDVIRQIMLLTLSGEYIVPGMPEWMDLSFKSSLSFVGSAEHSRISGENSNAKGDVQFSLALKLGL